MNKPKRRQISNDRLLKMIASHFPNQVLEKSNLVECMNHLWNKRLLSTKHRRRVRKAVEAYPLDYPALLTNWDKRPRPTPVGNKFRLLAEAYPSLYLCIQINMAREDEFLTPTEAGILRARVRDLLAPYCICYEEATLAGAIDNCFLQENLSMSQLRELCYKVHRNWEYYSKGLGLLQDEINRLTHHF